MKIAHYINFWALAITTILFVVPTFGMLAMIPLGIIQLLLGLGMIITCYRRLDRKRKALLLLYWLFVAIDFAGIAAIYKYDKFSNDLHSVPFLFIFPGCIAIYFVYTTYTITQYFRNGNATPQH